MTITLDRYLAKQKSKRDWKKHRRVADAARASGACFDCASRLGFAATDESPSKPDLCAKCERILGATS